MKNIRHHFLPPLVSGLIMILSVGCGRPQPSGIAGKVTFNGEPVAAGNIRFDPLEATPGHGASTRIEAGTYRINDDQGLYAGHYMVAISATRATGRTIAGEGLAGEANSIEEVEQYIPEQYNGRSQLRAELAAGENARDFALTVEP